MTVYVAAISGRGIVAFDAASEDEAVARLTDRALRRDLHVFQNQGRSLWDGVSEISLREALPNEVETWHARRPMVGQSSEPDENEDWRIFLVPVVDPTKFADDDDDRDDGD